MPNVRNRYFAPPLTDLERATALDIGDHVTPICAQRAAVTGSMRTLR